MNDSQEFFQELLFGEYGGWLGLLLILVLVFVASSKNKYIGILCLPLMLFLGIKYASMVDQSSNFYWSVLICFAAFAFLAYQAFADIRK